MNSTTDTHGFSLIELIVVITLASVFAVMMYQFVRSSTLKESDPVFSLATSLKLNEIIENITSDYLENYTTDLDGLQTRIGSTEESDQTNDYGSYRVIHNRFIRFTGNSEDSVPTGSPELREVLKVTIESPSSGEKITVLYNEE
jgi:prepilin-type N-terminal cleavage/methylation domain-containing protein